jgi:hypothetical protein
MTAQPIPFDVAAPAQKHARKDARPSQGLSKTATSALRARASSSPSYPTAVADRRSESGRDRGAARTAPRHGRRAGVHSRAGSPLSSSRGPPRGSPSGSHADGGVLRRAQFPPARPALAALA